MVVTATVRGYVNPPDACGRNGPPQRRIVEGLCGMVTTRRSVEEKGIRSKNRRNRDVPRTEADTDEVFGYTQDAILRCIRNSPEEESHFLRGSGPFWTGKAGRRKPARLVDVLGFPFWNFHSIRRGWTGACPVLPGASAKRIRTIGSPGSMPIWSGGSGRIMPDASLAGHGRKKTQDRPFSGNVPRCGPDSTAVMTVHEAKASRAVSARRHRVHPEKRSRHRNVPQDPSGTFGSRTSGNPESGPSGFRRRRDGGDILIWQNYTPEVWTALEGSARGRFRFSDKENFPRSPFRTTIRSSDCANHGSGSLRPRIGCRIHSGSHGEDRIRAAYAPRGANRFLL